MIVLDWSISFRSGGKEELDTPFTPSLLSLHITQPSLEASCTRLGRGTPDDLFEKLGRISRSNPNTLLLARAFISASYSDSFSGYEINATGEE